MTKKPKEIALKVVSLTKKFTTSKGTVNAVHDVSFNVEKGKFFGIIGESGSGKTTLGRTIIGLHPSTYGSIYFEDELINIKNLSRSKKRWKQRNIQMIFQDPMSSLNGKKNVLSLISEPLKINKFHFNKFHKDMEINKNVILNFRISLEKNYRENYFDFKQNEFKKSINIYLKLEQETKKILELADRKNIEEIIDFIESDYYQPLLDGNKEVISNVRHLFEDMFKKYKEFEVKYLNNEMEADEVEYNNAKNAVTNFKKHIMSSNKLLKFETEFKKLSNEKDLNVKKLTEIKFSAKTFITNFLRAIKTNFKDEYYKASISNLTEDYNRHRLTRKTFQSILTQFNQLPKKLVLIQRDLDVISHFKSVYIKQSTSLDKKEILLNKIIGVIIKNNQKHSKHFNAEITKNDKKIQSLKEEIAKEKNVIKVRNNSNKNENKSKYLKLKMAKKDAKIIFRRESKKVYSDASVWRKEFLSNQKSVFNQLKKSYDAKRKTVSKLLNHLIKKIFRKIKEELLVVKKEFKSGNINSKTVETHPDLSNKKMRRAALFEIKVHKRIIKQLMKKDALKRKGIETEIKLEYKRIFNLKSFFGITKLPRIIMKRKAKKNFLIDQVTTMLKRVGLKPEHAYRYPHEFSGGQRQRIGIARAIITKPKLIIADEPISALDVSIQAQIVNILKELSEKMGSTLVFIAHDLSMVSYICDEVIIMSKGRILEKGSTLEIFKDPKHPYTQELLNSVPELSSVHKDLAEVTSLTEYHYEENKEYDFVQVGKKNHYILADAKQAKTWLK